MIPDDKLLLLVFALAGMLGIVILLVIQAFRAEQITLDHLLRVVVFLVALTLLFAAVFWRYGLS